MRIDRRIVCFRRIIFQNVNVRRISKLSKKQIIKPNTTVLVMKRHIRMWTANIKRQITLFEITEDYKTYFDEIHLKFDRDDEIYTRHFVDFFDPPSVKLERDEYGKGSKVLKVIENYYEENCYIRKDRIVF